MSLTVEGQVGPNVGADGTKSNIRIDRTAAVVVGQAHGRFREATGRGVVYSASTGTPGVAPGTALNANPPFSLWNPLNSGINLSVLRTRMAYVSGTLGAGVLTYSFLPAQTSQPGGGTAIPIQCTRLTSTTGQGKAFQGSSLTQAPTLLFPVGTIQAVSAATASAPLILAEDDVDGEIEVPPGAILCLQAVGGAGTSPLVMFSMTWEEIPV
jgi:hypothetical protein